MSFGVFFMSHRIFVSIIVKHDACAAAINSSGFVPFAFSNREGTEYATSLSTPLPVDVIPEPLRKSPVHRACAFLSMSAIIAPLVEGLLRLNGNDLSDNVNHSSAGSHAPPPRPRLSLFSLPFHSLTYFLLPH